MFDVCNSRCVSNVCVCFFGGKMRGITSDDDVGFNGWKRK